MPDIFSPLVSVIIPLFNKELFIKDTLLSILNQSYRNLEIIIVDDGSTDDSYSIATSIHDSRLKFFSIKNSGVSNARNFGFGKSSGEYIIFFDADDIMNLNHIEFFITNIIKYTDSFIFATNYLTFKSRLSFTNLISSHESIIIHFDNFYKFMCIKPPFWIGSIIFNRKCFNDLDYIFKPNESSAEDHDLFFRLIDKHHFIYYKDTYSVAYRIDAQCSLTKIPIKSIEPAYQRLFSKYKYSSNDRINYPIRLYYKHVLDLALRNLLIGNRFYSIKFMLITFGNVHVKDFFKVFLIFFIPTFIIQYLKKD